MHGKPQSCPYAEAHIVNLGIERGQLQLVAEEHMADDSFGATQTLLLDETHGHKKPTSKDNAGIAAAKGHLHLLEGILAGLDRLRGGRHATCGSLTCVQVLLTKSAECSPRLEKAPPRVDSQ